MTAVIQQRASDMAKHGKQFQIL